MNQLFSSSVQPRVRRLLASSLLLTAMPGRVQAQAASASPRLVVFITVDQLSPEYFDRFAGQLTGGFARLLRGGAVFTNAFQDHATTETAPGHASTMSGRFPRSTGIVFNAQGVPDPQSPLIGGGGAGASPYRFRGGVLMDWLRSKDPNSRGLSISRKDRGAILPMGRAKQPVYWYATNGRFTTSTYYADTLPTWLVRFNARQVPRRAAGQRWNLLLKESEYSEPDTVAVESGGQGYVFPHVISSDSAVAARTFGAFPWMDQLTADAALAGLDALGLGRGPSTDILAVSFSTTDAIGHQYGTESRELHDQILRLDRTLGAFIDSIYRLRDSSTVIFALTSDHGVAPTPELWSARQHKPAYRVSLDTLGRSYSAAIAKRGLGESAFVFADAMVTVDRDAFHRAGVNADSVLGAFRREALRVPGVGRVDSPTALAADTTTDFVARRWMHSLPLDSPVALVVTLQANSVWGNYATGIHGGPQDYDARVPVIFYGPGFKAGRYDA
ncbi:MAG: alkaline phosphatase family protein, partial [Gemmatimonadaceae bacterium]|nr:alkaline phosphatase family protein [Gemmatimonadaceae bacterium]